MDHIIDMIQTSGVLAHQFCEQGFTRAEAIDISIKAFESKYAQYNDAKFLAPLAPNFGLAWLQNGFPCLEPGHKLGASLMCTSLSSESIDEVLLPWATFALRIPVGLLQFEHLLINQEGGKTRLFLWGNRFFTTLFENDLKSIIDVESSMKGDGFDANLLDAAKKNTLLAVRLLIGVCLEMASPSNVAAIAKGPRYPTGIGRKGEPTQWVFKITRDVKVDVRGAVAEYLTGQRKGPLSIQSLVRGHHKRQACGIGNKERRWIHIEPYWRGPEDAPIAVRNYQIQTQGEP